MRKERDVEGLIKALGHINNDVRSDAVQAIVEIGDPKAVEPLINALNDADWEVREKVAEALDKIRSRAVQL
jgi:HEAT repeat protein